MVNELVSVQSRLRPYIAQNFLFTEDYPHSDDTSFLREGIIDSLGFMELVLFVEQEIGVSVRDEDVTPDNFDSITKLANYVERHMALVAQ